MRPLPVLAAVVLAAIAPSCIVTVGGTEPPEPPAEDVVPTPQRPTFSSSTATTSRGTVEVEAGVAYDPGDAVDTPIVVKYGVADDLEYFAAFSPWRYRDARGGSDSSVGDLVLGLRQRIDDGGDDGPAVALQATGKIPTADEDEGFGTGEVDLGFAGIVQQTLDEVDVVGYWGVDLLGDPEDSGVDPLHTVALAGSYSLSERDGVFAELAALLPSGGDDTLHLTTGLTRVVGDASIADFAVQLGLDSDAPDFVVLVGITANLGAPGD